jgi:hypothetical protein
VAGKVIASSVKVTGQRSGSSTASSRTQDRPTSRPAPKPTPRSASRPGSKPGPSRVSRLGTGAKLFAPAPRGGKGGKQRSGAARTAVGTTRTIFFGAIVMLSAVVLVLVFKQFWLGDGLGDIPTMKLGDVLPDGPGRALEPSAVLAAGRDAGLDGNAAAAPPEWFTIRAAIYNGSERGLELAVAAHTELVLRGLPGVTLIGHEATDPELADSAEGGYASYELIVGAARTPDALEGTLDRLLAIDDWAGGKPAPFVDASIVGHPLPETFEPEP